MGNRERSAFRILEIVLCTLVAAALSRTVQGGFYVPDALHANYAVNGLVCLVLQAILFVEVFLPERRWVSRAVYAAVCIAGLAFSVSTATTLNPIEDVSENYFVACMIFALVNALVFALSRRHWTTVALLGAAGFIAGYIQLMYLSNMLVTTVAMIFAGLALLFLRTYLDAREAALPCAPLRGEAIATTVLLPIVLGLVGCFVVIGVIMPLDPPHAVVELQTEYLKYPEKYVKSAVSLTDNQDETESTDDVDEDRDARTTTDEKEDPESEQNNATGASDDQMDDTLGDKDYLSGDYSDVDLSNLTQGISPLALNTDFPWWIIVVVVVVLVVGILTVPRYVIHRRRLATIKRMAPKDQVVALYKFFLGRFARLGLAKPDNLSVVDYANLYRARLEPFVGVQEAGTFDHLTALYVAQEYGEADVDPRDLDALYYLYDRFYPRVRERVGTLRYVFRYFFL